MQISDEMVERAANAIAEKRGYAWPGTFDAEEIKIGRDNMRAALEAALSAAEPQPAPSVAITNAFMRGANYIANNVMMLDSPVLVMNTAKAATEYALSAQVQDVAGWRDEDKLTPEQAWTILCETPDITSPEEYPDHALITFEQLKSYMERAHNSVEWQDIITAPRDGTKILMRGGAYHGVPFPGYWETSPYSSDRPWVSIINDSRLYEHVPTHWMPLPAAPAKQEG